MQRSGPVTPKPQSFYNPGPPECHYWPSAVPILTMACLRASGTVPKLRPVFMNGTRKGPMMSLASFIILAGTASRVQVVDFNSLTAFIRSARETASKFGVDKATAGACVIVCLTVKTLSKKYSLNTLHVFSDISFKAADSRFITELMVVNRIPGRWLLLLMRLERYYRLASFTAF